jgi:myo-inositol-1(or 4)-monophosphatase
MGAYHIQPLWCDRRMPSHLGPDALADIAVELASGAGEIIQARRGEPLDVLTKSTPTDMVTAVDHEVEAWLSAQIAAHRPGDAILGEESAESPGHSGVRWIVDPIDGTVNFVLGLPQYAVSVAAEVDGTVVAGCVHNPASGEVFRASLGGGACLDGRRLPGPRDVPLARAVIGTGFGYDARRRARQGRVVAALLPSIADIRRIGAASLDLCSVAAGRLDGYFEAGLNPWDWAAGVLVAQEAGCVASGLRGRPAGAGVTAVAGPALAGPFFALLEQLGVDRL